MGRRYQEIEERAERALRQLLGELKESLKTAPAAVRLEVTWWLIYYFNAKGDLFSPQLKQKRPDIILNGREYWLVEKPPRRSRRPPAAG